jgi:hypothetical protein
VGFLIHYKGYLAGRRRVWRPEIPLYHTASILSRDFAKKVAQIIFPDFGIFVLDF